MMGGALDDDQQIGRIDTARPLDAGTRQALETEVAGAKARGWLQPDLKRWFKSKGVELDTYKAALTGGAVDADIAGTLAQISITGLPQQPHAPNPDDIRRHIDWLVDPARGAYDDALFEIAFDGEDRGPSHARLFALDEIDEAVAFAVSKNIEWRNIYIGAALRLPDSARGKRASSEDFYLATAVPIDIDQDYDTTRARMAAVCDDGLVVTTGMTPQRRSQHWARLVEPCDDEGDFGHAFAALVMHTGADMKVKDAARIMRLGGTVSFPKDEKKRAAGYCTELTSVFISDAARPSTLEAFKALEPTAAPGERFDASNRPQGSGVERQGLMGSGRVVNGRESHFRNLLLKHLARYQQDTGADPSAEELWELAFTEFCDPELVDNDDGRWTSPEGQRELAARLQNTLRRLRGGRLARFGLFSIDTEVGQDEALAVQAQRHATQTPATMTKRAAPQDDGDLFEVLTISDLRALPEATWIVKDAIPQGALGFVYGAPGSYKSFVCYDLALSLAYGHDRWLDRDIKHAGSVLYVASEGAMGAKNRITAWQAKHKIEADTDRFRLIRKSMSFMDVGDIERLERTVAAIVEASGPVDTIFVDTVSRVLPGADENLQKDMTIFVAACDRLRERFEATVIGVHHTNKNGEMRGSTVFAGQGDFIFRVDKSDDERGGVLTCDKQKDAEDAWKVSFSVEKRAWIPAGHIAEASSLTLNFGGEPELSDDGVQWPSREITRDIQRSIQQAWDRGKPWSPYPQTTREGRFAIRNISQDHSLKPAVAQMVLEAWLKNDVVSLETFDTHSKSKGLKVMKWID